MGLDAGIKLRYKDKEDKEQEIDLVYWRKYYELDAYLVKVGTNMDPDNQDDYYFEIPVDKLTCLCPILGKIFNLLGQYSDRIVNELEENGESPDFKKKDAKLLADYIYELKFHFDYDIEEGNSSFQFCKLKRLYHFISFLETGELFDKYSGPKEAKLVYWRSY